MDEAFTESLDPYLVIPLKHSRSIQIYFAKSTESVYEHELVECMNPEVGKVGCID